MLTCCLLVLGISSRRLSLPLPGCYDEFDGVNLLPATLPPRPSFCRPAVCPSTSGGSDGSILRYRCYIGGLRSSGQGPQLPESRSRHISQPHPREDFLTHSGHSQHSFGPGELPVQSGDACM
ncbi:hypothetical protein B0J12DRAFT_24502 [Macrophomina phaseolina]|uniref:Secreted protein n=1 Tax=Macrophomina phaseolina TaxID=35725 RepID=A0ABQ8GY30_9PEZI|nr:hypothetical protein B0J12DRAFT_24502 [Macrophomina phaseolina]